MTKLLKIFMAQDKERRLVLELRLAELEEQICRICNLRNLSHGYLAKQRAENTSKGKILKTTRIIAEYNLAIFRMERELEIVKGQLEKRTFLEKLEDFLLFQAISNSKIF